MAKEDLRQLTDEITLDELSASLTMQVATTRDGRPWNSSVYFIVHDGNFYWLSFPERRHSQDLLRNPYAAIAIVIQATQPVVGIQAEGGVDVVNDIDEARAVLDLYIKKYNQGSQFVTHLEAGTNRHSLYRFSPRRVMVFNERDASRSEPSPREVIIT